jgi:hypothetical protein
MFMDGPADEADAVVGVETFFQLVRAVERCVEAGRFDDGDTTRMATQIWALSHGVVTLHLAGFLPLDFAVESFRSGGQALFKAFGDEPRALARSVSRSARVA